MSRPSAAGVLGAMKLRQLREAGYRVVTDDEYDAVEELRQGNGLYYVAQERWGAPGIAGEADDWPKVVEAPHTEHGRLVKRLWPESPEDSGD